MLMSHLFAVGLGAAIGGIARFALSSLIGINGILIVNLLGCFFIGVVVSLLALKFSVPQIVHLFMTVGLLGGFTTFSTFSLEAMAMIDTHKYMAAMIYIATSVFGGLLAFLLGRFLVRLWL